MRKMVEVRNIKLGEGMPKVCVPIMGKNNEELIREIQGLKNLKIDLIEWRMDYHQDVTDKEKMQEVAKLLRTELGDMPLLATFRSKKEGGEKELATNSYMELNKAIVATGVIDLIDVELLTGDELVREMVSLAHKQGVKVIISNHDFLKTPSQEEMISRLCKMQELGADLPKIAVMPQDPEDVLTLLSATYEMTTKYADRPIIAMAMKGMGIVSRLAGEIFGSAVTFGAAGKASAPGQLPVEELVHVLETIHRSMA